MKKIKLLVLMLAFALTAVSANAADIAHYDASVGSPTVAGDVEDPLDQGWSILDTTLGTGDVQEGVIDANNVPAWRNLDGTANNNPGYVVPLTFDDYQNMYDNGWTLTFTVRLLQGGQFMYWGGDNTNTVGGFNFPGDRRVGLSLSASGDHYNATTIVSTGSSGAVTVTNGILNGTYITVTITGAAGTTTFDAEIKETVSGTVLFSETGLGFANGNASTDAHTGFMSGSSGGDFRDTYYQHVQLSYPNPVARVPDPSNGETDVEVDLLARDVQGEVSWIAPDYAGATYDVYFGTTEPNDLLAGYGLTQIGTAGQAATSAAPTALLPLDNDTTYYWVVDSYEPNDVGTQIPTLYPGKHWSFTTITALPVINTQPLSKTAASADLVIEVTNPGTYEWYQVGNPVALQTTTTTATSDTYTTGVEGYYYCIVKNAALPAGLQSDVVRVMNPRLVGHWELNGDLTDSSTEGRTGDYVDPNTAEPNPDDSLVDYVTGADGTVDGAVKFNGYNLVEIPDSNEFFYFHKQGLTLTAWVLGPSSGDWKRPVDTNNYGIVQHDSNSISVIVSNTGGWKTVVPGAEGSEDEWRFVAITYEPNDLDPSNGVRVDYGIYDDDDLVDVLHRTVYTTGTPGGDISQNLSIGGSELDNPDTAYNYDGAVDDVRVYNYALTSEEIQAVYGELNDDPLCLTLDNPAIAPYDYNNDCKVTMEDFAVFSASWMDSQLVTP